jgi:NADPH-dependent 2,4-dienoyl-CoA reductase/sulfur reductase-like enzyme
VWGAGDAARPWDPSAGAHVRAEHWEAAARQGSAVAHGILGLAPVAAPTAFWTDQYGIRLHFAGTAVGHDALAVEGDLDGADARILYLRRGRPVGGLLVGRPRSLPDLRRLLAGGARQEVAAP